LLDDSRKNKKNENSKNFLFRNRKRFWLYLL